MTGGESFGKDPAILIGVFDIEGCRCFMGKEGIISKPDSKFDIAIIIPRQDGNRTLIGVGDHEVPCGLRRINEDGERVTVDGGLVGARSDDSPIHRAS